MSILVPPRRRQRHTQGLGYGVSLPDADRASLRRADYQAEFAAFVGWRQVRARVLPAEAPAAAGHRLSCGAGANGPRAYDRAVRRANRPKPRAYARWLLIRRSPAAPEDVASFACGGPPGTTLGELARVAAARWAIEDLFELAKGDCGREEYEVRSWVGWHRHVTLSPFALAVVAVLRSRAAQAAPRERGGAKLTPRTVPQVRTLLLRRVWDRLAPAERARAWSEWRRRHQYRVRRCRYRRRGARPPN